MTEGMETLIRAALVGIGGTVILDLWAIVMQRVFNVSVTNWAMVGRWVGVASKLAIHSAGDRIK